MSAWKTSKEGGLYDPKAESKSATVAIDSMKLNSLRAQLKEIDFKCRGLEREEIILKGQLERKNRCLKHAMEAIDELCKPWEFVQGKANSILHELKKIDD